MKVCVIEYAAGGALAGRTLPADILAQGTAMWRAAIADFQAAGAQVRTTRDARIEPIADVTAAAVESADAFHAAFDQQAAWADAVLVIAPEFDDALASLLDRLSACGVRSLGCDPAAVRLCSDKLVLAHHLARYRVPTPTTTMWHAGEIIHRPTILKPRSGAGCEQTFIVYDEEQAAEVATDGQTIMQTLARGRPVSASYLVRAGRPTPLLAGRQFVHGEQRFAYHGGRIPLPGTLAQRAIALGAQAINAIPGLAGYVGVDMVLGDDPTSDTVIEINPRLTMSYLGLRELSEINLAAAMLDDTIEPRFRDGQVRFDETGHVVWEQIE